MGKKSEKISDTQLMRQAIPSILKGKFENGATFEELWNELYKDKKLAKIMLNSKKEKRLGLLQGLTNRIKADKEENIAIIRKEDGKNYYIYFDNSIEKLCKITENYLQTIKSIDTSKDSKLTKEKEEIH